MSTVVRFYPLIADDKLRYAVIVARMAGQWIFCKHRARRTLECPGGHREPGEAIERTARRELFEETGATCFTLEQVCAYSVQRDGSEESFGMLFRAEIQALGDLPTEFEMERILRLSTLPSIDEWTYPEIQPRLLARAGAFALSACGEESSRT